MIQESDLYFNYSTCQEQNIGAFFNEVGIVIVRDVLSLNFIQEFKKTLLAIIKARMISLGKKSLSADLDDAYNQLIAFNESSSMEIVLAARDLPCYYNMIVAPEINKVITLLLGETLFQVVHDICLFRIDSLHHSERNFPWHQDYPYNVLSRKSVTVWAPLTPITKEMGYLQVVPGSHQAILPVNFQSPSANERGQGKGHQVFSLRDVDTAAFEAQSLPLTQVNPGDVVFFDGCLLHRSGKNASQRSRWVSNIRFGDLLEPNLVSRGWKVVRDKNPYVFSEVHPELITCNTKNNVD